uniref:Uncharacterized protein n=1 Tax=Anguilla anguilla TaxID=7936 RepID=A0A0E9PC92_ANGAN
MCCVPIDLLAEQKFMKLAVIMQSSKFRQGKKHQHLQ